MSRPGYTNFPPSEARSNLFEIVCKRLVLDPNEHSSRVQALDYALRKVAREIEEMNEMKEAHIITKNFQGQHSSGTAERATMELRAGAKGTGGKIHSAEYWPWSSPSVEAAYSAMYEMADKAGYKIIQ